MSDSIVIVSAARTPIGGLLGDFPPRRLGAGRRRHQVPPSSAPACRAMPSTKC
jgi:hypothetical protein